MSKILGIPFLFPISLICMPLSFFNFIFFSKLDTPKAILPKCSNPTVVEASKKVGSEQLCIKCPRLQGHSKGERDFFRKRPRSNQVV